MPDLPGDASRPIYGNFPDLVQVGPQFPDNGNGCIKKRPRSNNGCEDSSGSMSSGALDDGLNGLGAQWTNQPCNVVDNLPLRGLPSEHDSRNGDCNQQERCERKE